MAHEAELYDSAMKHLISSRDTTDPQTAAKRIGFAIKFLSDLREELYRK